MSVAIAVIQLRPRYFADIIANLLFWLDEDRILFGSDYPLWHPKWLIEKFLAFELPEDIEKEYSVELTPQNKRKILGENAARLYGIDIDKRTTRLRGNEIGVRMADAQ